ncbi:unnamed protein product, partial [Durusdinium trenchii]
MDKLAERSLPRPALAIMDPEILSGNFTIIDQRFERRPGTERCRLILAFDHTYLTKTLCQISLFGKKGIVGGAWAPENPQNAFFSLEEGRVDIKAIPKASSMMACVCWDPSAPKKACLSACAIPLGSSFEGLDAKYKGNWAMLHTLGTVLSHSDQIIRGIAFDAATTHQFIRKVLCGQLQDVDLEELRTVPFFGELEWQELPENPLPRLPVRIAMYRGKAVWALPGPCHAGKNSGGQLASCLRTSYYGSFWADHTACREMGLPPLPYARGSPMSDRFQAIRSNPHYLDSDYASMTVPWSLKGCLLHHLCVTLCLAPAFHRDISLQERAEAALSGFLCLDMFQMLAMDKCKQMCLPAGSTFMAPVTCANLQYVALSTVVVCLTKDIDFEPWRYGNARLTEIAIEQVFGHLRSQMSNSQLTTRQYFAADARQSFRSSNTLNRIKLSNSNMGEEKLTHQQFETCCKNALAATLSLVSKVSDMKSSILEAMYRKRCEQEIEDPEDGDPLEELEEEEDVKPHAKSKTECEEFLEHLQQDAECNRMWASEDPDAFAAQDQEDPLGVDAETKDLPDGELLKHLCTLANVAEAFGMETAVSPKSGERREGNHLPSSLLEAVQMKGDLFNSLFRLLVRLRSAKGGMDT